MPTRAEFGDVYDDVWKEKISPAIINSNKDIDTTEPPPEFLLHFTSTQALVSILQNRTLRVSRARASNDPSELDHGLDLAWREQLKYGRDALEVSYREELKKALRGLDPTGRPNRHAIDPHILCFSEADNTEVPAHWALYGRGGRGVALKFKGDGIKKLADQKGIGLAKVIYDETEQTRIMKIAVERLLNDAKAVHAYAVEKYGQLHGAMLGIAAHAFGGALTGIAATMKRHGYSIEREWRLLSTGNGVRPSVDVVEDIVRTFYLYEFDPNILVEVILGPVLVAVNAQAIEKLLAEFGFDHVKVSVADVSFRTVR